MDDDYDGLGNACDVYNCTITNSEVCGDGVDNDCNQQIDENCMICGNGTIETGEQCDDGNIQDGDGCSAVCQNEVVPESLVINEVDYDQQGMDTAEFIELKNTSAGSVNLDAYEIRLINGNGPPSVYNTIVLPSVSLTPGDYYVVCSSSAAFPTCDMTVSPGSDIIQNGGSYPDAIVLYNSAGAQVDTLSYEGNVPGYTEGTGAVEDVASMNAMGLSRYPDGQDTNNNSIDFVLSCSTPGNANVNYPDCANPPTPTPTPTPEAQCKNENAECAINQSGMECCAGLTCTLFNPNSGNYKCVADATPTPTPTPETESVCGDGLANGQEQCDYGSLNGQSSCSSQCTWVNDCRAEMVANSGFETPVVSQGAGWDAFDNAEMAGWTAAWYGGSSSYNSNVRPEPQVEMHRGVNGWLPPAGSQQYVELDTDWTGPVNDFSGEPASIALTQNIPTIVGNEYTVSWKYSARPSHSNNNLLVSVGLSDVFTSGVIAGGSNTNWQTQSYTFVATSTMTPITFTEIGTPDSLGMFLDDVQVACNGVPKNNVTICKVDQNGLPQAGWTVGLSLPIFFTPIESGLKLNSANLTLNSTSLLNSGPLVITDPNNALYGDFLIPTPIQYNSASMITIVDGSGVTGADGCTTFHQIPYGEYGVVETDQAGWTYDSTTIGSETHTEYPAKVTVGATVPEIILKNRNTALDAVTVVAQKVICNTEADLPNWSGSGTAITATTAQDYVAAHSNTCHLADVWDFQWAPAGAGTFDDFQTNGAALGSPWTTFSAVGGTATASIPSTTQLGGRIETREILSSEYVPFSNSSNVSAEFYCTGDVANYDNWEWINNPQAAQTYYCVGFNAIKTNDVTVCKEDSSGNPLNGWKVGLSQPIGFDQQIPVDSGAGVDATLSENGAYVVYASGTYRYGNDAMIADAGNSFRPVGIPYGTGGWVSGDDLLSVPGALELKVGGQDIQWGGFNAGHQYATYLTGMPAGTLNLSIWDDNYGDNTNNGNFRASIDQQKFAGNVGQNGCITFEDVPYGDYHVFEAPVEDWTYQSTSLGDQVISNYPASVSVGNQVPEITLTNQFVGGGTIRIIKDVTPDDTQTKFDYTLSNTAGYTVSDQVWESNPSGYTNLFPGTYTLSETDLPNYVETISCSNGQTSSTNTITFSLQARDDVVCTVTNTLLYDIHGYKWKDTNHNGINDQEQLLSGWEIFIDQNDNQQWDGSEPKTTTSSEAEHFGWYWFKGLLAGTYSICEVTQSGWAQTYPLNPTCHSVTLPDANPQNLAFSVNYVEGPEYNFGNFEKGDMDVWKYEDTDGILGRSGSETWIGDPTFTFRVYEDTNGLDAGGWVIKATANTNTEGKAEFTNVFDTVGQYYVCEVKTTGWEDMRSRNNTANNESGAPDEYAVCDGITVPGSGYVRSAEFGNIHKGFVTVNKFHDRNTNGVRDSGEELMDNWDMTLAATNGFSQTQSTTADSGALFTIDPQTYYLSETQKEGWEQSGVYCTSDTQGTKITADGEAYGHHGACSGWNGCGDAATCAQWACEVNGYQSVVSYGAQKPCTEFQSCNLFYNRGNVQMGWGNWCQVMGVTDIVCGNRSATPTPTPSQAADRSSLLDKVLGVTQAHAQPAPTPDGHQVIVNPGDRITCYVGNYQPGSIQGTKYFDNDKNGSYTEGESKMQYWGISLAGNGITTQQVTTDENGEFSFANLKKGTYTLCEEDRTDWGWQVTEPVEPINQVCREVIIDQSGETEVANFGNFIDSRLYILKTNDAWPNDATIGDEVTYTIRVMAVGGPVYDASVFDVPPRQFTYVPDSYTAESSDGTDLRADGTTGDPNYQSPGSWQLGDLTKDEIVTLTYKTKVGSLADPGVYPDMVWATGTSEQSAKTEGETNDLLALSDPDFSANSGGIDFDGSNGHFGEDNFAGTQVAIVVDQTPSSEFQVGKTEEKQGAVLGASTELPATGARTWLTLLALLSILAGAGFLMIGKRSRNSGLKTILGLFVVGFSLFFAQPAQALTSVRVEEPYNNSTEFTQNAITNQTNMKIDFVVLNVEGLHVTAQCQQQKNDGAWINITTNYTMKAGGNSGYCEANDLENTQNYDFRVVVSGDGPDKISDEVRVGLETSRPDKPVNYSKTPGNYCEDKISFKTANDGQTTSVEVYRSTDSDHFTAKPDTRVITISIGPNQDYTLTTSKPNCDSTYYYVIRAFDINGNASDLVGDQEIKTVIIESASGTTQTAQLGAIPAGSTFVGVETAGGSTTGNTAEENDGTTEDVTAADETTTESTNGSVLGSTTETFMSYLSRFGLPIGVGLIVLAGLYVIFFGKRHEK